MAPRASLLDLGFTRQLCCNSLTSVHVSHRPHVAYHVNHFYLLGRCLSHNLLHRARTIRWEGDGDGKVKGRGGVVGAEACEIRVDMGFRGGIEEQAVLTRSSHNSLHAHSLTPSPTPSLFTRSISHSIVLSTLTH